MVKGLNVDSHSQTVSRRERERMRERERKRDRQTERQTDRQTDKETDRQTERQRQTCRQTKREREREKNRQNRLDCNVDNNFQLATLKKKQLPCALTFWRKRTQIESWKVMRKLKVRYKAGIVNRLLNASNKVSVSEAKRGIENRGDINGSQVRGKSDSLQEI